MAKRGENIYKRKDGRYEGRYIKGRTINGKPIFGYIYAYTYSEVKRELTCVKAASEPDKHIRIIKKGSLTEFLRYWLENIVKERVKPSTYAQYRDRIERHIIPALGKMPVSKLTKSHIQGFADNLVKNGLMPSTVSNIAGIICSSMKTAVELHLVSENPCNGLNMPKVAIEERRALSRAEQLRLERQADSADTSTALAVFLALYAGLRIGEICALRWKDVDFFSGTLTIQSTLQRIKDFDGGKKKTVLIEGAPKSKHSFRRIPPPDGLMDKLRLYGKGMRDEYYVLTGNEKPLEPRTLRARFARLSAKAGISVPFHCLRHTFSTRCLEHNFDIQSLSELLGHSSASTTLTVYAHSILEHKRLLTGRIHILSENIEPSNEPSIAIAEIAENPVEWAITDR